MKRQSLRRLQQAAHDPFNCLVSRRGAVVLNAQGPLKNTRFVVKDNICTTSEPTTCASRMLADYTSPFAATAVTLLERAGSAMVGKANMDEFGMGSSTTFSSHGPTVNPRYADTRIAGGSSGGSAAAVAGGLCDFALGTDTGGSVRQPASYCGVVGLKPTYGRVSRHGVVAYGQGYDCVGILAKNVATVRDVFAVLDAHDPSDITSMPEDVRAEVARRQQARGHKARLRIGIPSSFLLGEVEPATLSVLETVLARLMDLGHSIHPVSLPTAAKSLPAYYTLAVAEAASNLSRFDGIRFGSGVAHPENASGQDEAGNSLIARNRTAGFGPEVQRRLIVGNYTLSSESGNAYVRATQIRRKMVEEFNDVLAFPNSLLGTAGRAGGCDVLIAPTVFGRAPLLEEHQKQSEETFMNEYLNDVLTVPASLAGLPSVSVPGSDADYGVQVMGQYGDDQMVMEVAQVIEALGKC